MSHVEENSKYGYIALYRSIRNSWIWPKGSLTELDAWIMILLECNHKDKKVSIGGAEFVCRRGESLNSLETWARLFKWSKSKVRRYFEKLKKRGMIELKTATHQSAQVSTQLTVLNYASYQTPPTQQSTRKPTPNNKYIIDIQHIVDHLNKVSGKNFRDSTKSTMSVITARLNEGYSIEDLKAVVDLKCAEWRKNEEMQQYIRPQTLFSSQKFEGYLNAVPLKNTPMTDEQRLEHLQQLGKDRTEKQEIEYCRLNDQLKKVSHAS